MNNYKVKAKWVFEGTIDVRANSKKEALEIVKQGFNHPTIDIGNTTSYDSNSEDEEGIVDWNVGLHSTDEKFK